MIRTVQSVEKLKTLCEAFASLRAFLDAHPEAHQRILQKLYRDEHTIGFAAFEGDRATGLFAFRQYFEERILELSEWITDSEYAADEMLAYLKEAYSPGQVEFTFRPEEMLLHAALLRTDATVYPEQMDMRLAHRPTETDTSGVALLSERYLAQYCALHDAGSDAYLDGEEVASRPETFRVFVAVKDGRVVGYLDVTHCYETNNISDLYVDETQRRKGYGRKLLAKAIEMNHPKEMTLQVDIDNEPAIRLYEKMGFEKIPNRNTIDAIWKI